MLTLGVAYFGLQVWAGGPPATGSEGISGAVGNGVGLEPKAGLDLTGEVRARGNLEKQDCCFSIKGSFLIQSTTAAPRTVDVLSLSCKG